MGWKNVGEEESGSFIWFLAVAGYSIAMARAVIVLVAVIGAAIGVWGWGRAPWTNAAIWLSTAYMAHNYYGFAAVFPLMCIAPNIAFYFAAC